LSLNFPWINRAFPCIEPGAASSFRIIFETCLGFLLMVLQIESKFLISVLSPCTRHSATGISNLSVDFFFSGIDE